MQPSTGIAIGIIFTYALYRINDNRLQVEWIVGAVIGALIATVISNMEGLN